jgi:acrylyl-CoA reductase (NADPH)
MFRALVLEKDPWFKAEIRELSDDNLPPGDVALEVTYSSINYKEALAITNRSPVVRNCR